MRAELDPSIDIGPLLTSGKEPVLNERTRGTVLIFVLFCLPLAVVPCLLLEYYTTPKLAVAYLSAAILCLTVSTCWPGALALWRTLPGRWLFGVQLALFGSLLVSTLVSNNVWRSLGGTPTQRLGLLTHAALLLIAAVLAVHAYRHHDFFRSALLAMEAAAGVASVYAILQFFGHDPLFPASLYTVGSVVRPAATLGQATYFASFLLPGALIAAWLLVVEKKLAWRAFHGLLLVVTVIAVLLSGTRSALLGLMLGLAILGYSEGRFLGRRNLLRYAAVAMLALVAITSALVVSPLGRSFRARLEQWRQDSRGGPRLMVWHDSLGLIARHWAFGVGPETFAGEFRKIQSLELSRTYPDHFHESPHNIFLEAAAGQGIFGLAAWLALLGLGVVCGVRLIRAGCAGQGGVLLASLTALVISLQFSPVTIPICLHIYVIVALLAALAAPPCAPTQGSGRGSRLAVPSPVRLAAPLAGIVFVVSAVMLVGQDALVAVTTKRLAASDLDGSDSAYQLLRRSLFTADSLWCSNQAASFARTLPDSSRGRALDLARLASADAARNGDQTFAALYQSATLAIIAGDASQAEAYLRADIVAFPYWYRAHLMLAQLLWSLGRAVEADKEAALALEYAGTVEPTVRVALARAKPVAQSAHPFSSQ